MTDAGHKAPDVRRLAVITTPDLAPGYRLAGVATRLAASSAEAIECLGELVGEGAPAGIVAMHEPFLRALPSPARRRLEESMTPLVIPLPAGTLEAPQSERREQLLRMLWQAIGYQITFEPRERE